MVNVFFPTLVNAPVTQVFGNYNPALYGGDRRHKGIDYGVLPGAPVYACMDGVVSLATIQQTGYGRHIRILHPDGSLSVYGHLNRLMTSNGYQVKAGDEIGKSGGDPKDNIDGDGLSTGPHLHWEIRPPGKHLSDQDAVDPMEWCLQYVSVRLEVAEVTAAVGLNVRSEPNASSTRLGALHRKQIIYVAERSGSWARLHSLRPEWVHKDFLYFTGKVIEPVDSSDPKPIELSLEEKVSRLWNAHPELHGEHP